MLSVVVALPTASLLWFMSEAVKSERLAGRQRLSEVYAAQLEGIRAELEASLRERAAAAVMLARERAAGATFARAIAGDLAESLLVYGPDGELAFPATEAPPSALELEPETERAWREAEELEYASGEPLAAAEVYGRIAAQSGDANVIARALQARARSLAAGGEREAALGVLLDELATGEYDAARDARGAAIVPNALLFALELSKEPGPPRFTQAFQRLATQLTSYDQSPIASPQRRFLMREFRVLSPEWTSFPTLPAEELAARYLDADPVHLAASAPEGLRESSALRETSLAGVWQLDADASPSARLRLLFTEGWLVDRFAPILERRKLPHARIELLRPEAEPSRAPASVVLTAAASLPRWRLAVVSDDPALSDSAAEERVVSYLAVGILVVALVLVAGAVAARIISRQVRVTRLKNDLLATVSHELKTPLASMRLLVDTLLAQDHPDERQTREYLELVARENTRLSRMIESFLAFSRMARNKQRFEKRELDAREVVDVALESAAERLRGPGCHLEVEVEPNLPRILGDRDALVTVLLNLLDNAWKYSREEKHIALRARAENGEVRYEVEDDGIGMSPREARRVFERFYQVDQRVARKSSGVGLGLSIVDFIVRAHGGSVAVESEPGRGSTFTVRLPAVAAGAHHSRAAL